MKDDKIKPGDVVQLKSGRGPAMVVGEVDTVEPLTATCVWWDEEGGFVSEDIGAVVLRRVNAPDACGDDAPDSLPPDSGPARSEVA